VLRFIRGYIADKGRPPTLREIADGMGFASTNGTRYHLAVLEREGWIERDPIAARGIRVCEANGRTPSRQAAP